VDENVQEDATMLVVRNSIELRSITARSALAPELNVMFRVENNERAVKNRKEGSFLTSQIAQQDQEITQTVAVVQGGGAGKVELGVPMADNAPLLAHTDCLKAS